jgi:hypothetical protein
MLLKNHAALYGHLGPCSRGFDIPIPGLEIRYYLVLSRQQRQELCGNFP